MAFLIATLLQADEQSLVMNIGNIIANLPRYRKPAVLDTDQTRFLASTDNEITEHVDTRQDLAIKPLSLVRVSEPMVTDYMLPFILHGVAVSGEAFMHISIREGIDTEKMGIDERSQVLFQKCVGHKKCQASIGCGNPLDI